MADGDLASNSRVQKSGMLQLVTNKGSALTDAKTKKKDCHRETEKGNGAWNIRNGLATCLLVCVVSNNDRNNNSDDGNDEECKEEADPPLFSCGASRDYGLVRVASSGE